jgi:hypothetical protein
MLEEFSETLDKTYQRTLREINKANREHAHRLLQCLAAAVRPLRIAELAEVLTIDFEAPSSGEISKLKTDWRWEDQEQAVLSTCSSLIAVVDEDGFQVVQFSHKYGRLAFPHSPGACTHGPRKGLPGYFAAV